MEFNRKYSRVKKFKRHRSLTKRMTSLFIVGGCLIIILGIFITLSKKDQEAGWKNNNRPVNNLVGENNDSIDGKKDYLQNDPINDSLSKLEDEKIEQPTHLNDELDKVAEEEGEEVEIEVETDFDIEVVASDEENILEIYIGNWKPVGTIQEEPHKTNYANESQDRIEMNQAVSLGTGLAEDDIITWWVGNGGEEKVIVTVSNKQQSENYRVYLSWIAYEGWQPTKVERLKENDMKN